MNQSPIFSTGGIYYLSLPIFKPANPEILIINNNQWMSIKIVPN